MPRKKRCASKVWKGKLLFTETPKEGRIYHYGSPFQSVDNPRCVPTKPVNQADTVWIIPQFESNSSLDFQNFKKKDADHVVHQLSGRRLKTTARRFSPLIFKNVSSSYTEGDSGCSLDLGDQAGALASIRHPSCSRVCIENASHCGLSHYANPAAVSPPDISTPEQTPVSNHNECLPQMNSFTPGSNNKLSCEDTPHNLGDSSVLVQDTPENEYGVKVTWRSRPHLMKYLRKNSLLSTSDILVKTNMSAICIEAKNNI